jgi:serine/threonine protein kinase
VSVRPGRLPKSFGAFEVLAMIGRGGTAAVYKVRHKVTGELAALKVGPPYLQLEAGALDRFQQEFTAISPLSHPNVVRALSQGEQDGASYLVLELVPGQNLDEHLKQKGALTPADAVAIFLQVADGLRYLHANHIVHRDIKPSNIFLTPDHQAKLGDFGLLKNLKDSLSLTRSRQAMGTIDYGAPEQFEDAKRVDRRCDLYSLAATFYTALTGKFPFGNGNPLQIMARKSLNQFVPLRLLLPSLDGAIDRLVNRCLEAQPGQRPSGCDEFIAVLRHDRNDAGRPAPVADSAAIDFPNSRPATGRERRTTVRFAVDLTATFVPYHQNMRGRWEATILDVSREGICLQTPRSVAVNSVLQVNLGKRATMELVLVRWVKPGKGETHIAGCSFVHVLANQDFEAICHTGSSKACGRPAP